MAPRSLTWLVLFGFLFALFLRVVGFGKNTDALTLRREQNTYLELRRIISERYVDQVQQQKLFYGALKGMAAALDKHTVFWPPQQFEFERSATSGHFAGVGIERGELHHRPAGDGPDGDVLLPSLGALAVPLARQL